MRKKNQKQMPLMPSDIAHPRAKELDRISKILDSVPNIVDMVLQDLTHGVEHRSRGAQGMTAEQVLRAAIIKQTEEFSYEDLAFHLVSSIPARIVTFAALVSPKRVSGNPLFVRISNPFPPRHGKASIVF